MEHTNIKTRWEATPNDLPDLVHAEYVDGEWDDEDAARWAIYEVRVDHQVGERTNQPGVMAGIMLVSNTDRLRRHQPMSEDVRRRVEDAVFIRVSDETTYVW